MGPRRLIPREYEHLQGFPGDYTAIVDRQGKPAPDSPRFKALGNSMAVPVMSWICERIEKAIDGAGRTFRNYAILKGRGNEKTKGDALMSRERCLQEIESQYCLIRDRLRSVCTGNSTGLDEGNWSNSSDPVSDVDEKEVTP
jgi:hypothetical protein